MTKGHDQGKVEGVVGYARRNFLVPLPQVASFAQLNAILLEACTQRQAAVLRSHDEAMAARLLRDRAAFFPLPADPFEACATLVTHVSSLSLVRYRTNDDSVPTQYGHWEVVVRGDVDRVVVSCRAEILAVHPRSYEREDFIFNPLPYLALLERKPNALEQAAPLAGWPLPPLFARLRRLLEGRWGKPGRKEYIQVLRLIEGFGEEQVAKGIEQALELGAVSFDAVKHLVLCRLERRPPKLNLDSYPYWPRPTVERTDPKTYLALLSTAKPRTPPLEVLP